MADENLTLVIKHLPSDLTSGEQEDLLRHFGATTVKTMGNKGRMKHTAFASFADHETAEKALKRLHQLEVLGRRLVVEFSNSQLRKNHPTQTDTYKDPPKVDDGEGKKVKPLVRADDINMIKVAENVNSFARQWDVKYAIDPRLEYIYPQPTVNILTNIANALASVPRFYIQVLHLMNKMNLPAPFGAVTPTPVLPEDAPIVNGDKETSNKSTTSAISELRLNHAEEGGSTEESEMESDEEHIADKTGPQPPIQMKRKNKSAIRPSKRLKLIQNLPQANKPKSSIAKPSDVFEQPDVSGPKKIAFNLSRGEDEAAQRKTDEKPMETESVIVAADGVPAPPPEESPMMPLPGAPPLPPPEPTDPSLSETPDLTNTTANKDLNPPLPPETNLSQEHGGGTQDPPSVELGGFGKFNPVAPAADNDNESSEEEWGEAEFISSKALRKGRISSSEKREHSVFKNYQRGEVSTRLYIKNIAKQVTDKDLHYVFGRYVDWSKEEHKNMFDIRLMKEGRMKGQAFVTLPNIELAKDALCDTHGFMLHGKPIAVQFARSAKAKEDSSKDKKSKT